MWPSIDHSFLSPSGHISKRSKKIYMDKFIKELFPEGMKEAIKPKIKQPTEKERMLMQAKRLQDLADAGMSARKYTKEAAKLRAQAARIANCPMCGKEKSFAGLICPCEVDNTGMLEFWRD
jgi:5'-deoxynucleotidase YfbR-like HD superfamily hydrolase